MKHRQQISDLEQQQENRVAESLCDYWKVNHTAVSFCVHSFVYLLYSNVCFCVFLETPYLLVKKDQRASQRYFSHLRCYPVKRVS